MTSIPTFCLLALAGYAASVRGQPASPSLPTIEKFSIRESPIQLSQPVRRGKYIDAPGRRAVLIGREEGVFEAWVYPMKIARELRLTFNIEGYSYPMQAAELAEWITVRPECRTITWSHAAFTVRAHLLTPVDEPGSLILLDVDSSRKMSITVSFLIDLVPMWPGGLGGQYSYWDESIRAFVLSESLRQHTAVVGSPAATRYSKQPAHNLPDSPTQFHIDVDPEYAGKNFIPIAICAGLDAPEVLRPAYLRLLEQASELYEGNVRHFERLRNELAQLKSPEPELDRAVEWAKVALDAGFVCNPQLGCGQVAGLGASGTSARPGFAWFFGGDTFINSFAVASTGDFANLRQELAFLRDHQRQDGKMMHELSQAGAMIPWFEKYPYGYYHGDTTPLYLIAVDNYLRHSGDVSFLRESSDSLVKAYRFCLSTDTDGDGLMENSKAGLAAIETGALLLSRTATDVYLAAVSTEAHRAMSHLAAELGEKELSTQAAAAFDNATASLNREFWSPDSKLLSFAVSADGGRMDEVTIWPAVSLMFRLIQPDYAAAMLDRLEGGSVSADWGPRMLTDSSRLYDPLSYNNGSVWPFLTGFLSWAEYRNHRPLFGFQHWLQNARLAYFDALGYAPELLSGDRYQALDTAVPHQLFSSAGVLTPLLKGLLGFEPDAGTKTIRLEPHLPVRWPSMEVRNLRVGAGSFAFTCERSERVAVFRIQTRDLAGHTLFLSPEFEPGARVLKAAVNGSPVTPAETGREDNHCEIQLALSGDDEIRMEMASGLRIVEPAEVLEIGARSSGLRVLGVVWNRAAGEYTIRLEGKRGRSYSLRVLFPQRPASVSGAVLSDTGLDVSFPNTGAGYVGQEVVVRMR